MPQGEVAKQAPDRFSHRLRTSGSQSQLVIRLEELNQPNAGHGKLFDGALQIGLCWNTKDDQVTRFVGPVEPSSCLQTRMANLDKLLWQRNVSADQDISI